MATGTYVPFRGRTDQCKASYPAMVAPAGLVAGTGSPEGIVFGNPGQRYRDLSNDDLYVKATGTQSNGWLICGKYGEGSPGSGGGGTIYSSVDPTDVISIIGPAMCLGTGPMDGRFWVKTTAGNSAADWFAVIT